MKILDASIVPTLPLNDHTKEILTRKLRSIRKKYHSLYLYSVLGKLSPRQAIKQQCYECIGYSDVRNNIADCKGYCCPLYAYRPYYLNEKGKVIKRPGPTRNKKG